MWETIWGIVNKIFVLQATDIYIIHICGNYICKIYKRYNI